MKLSVSVATLLACAVAPAFGSIPKLGVGGFDSNAPIVSVVELGLATDDAFDAAPRAGGNNMFAAMDGPYAAFAAAGGVLGFDDYVAVAPPGDGDGWSPLQEFGFIGGVTTAGMSLQVQFYDSTEAFITSFNITLPTGGSNQIWTITPTMPATLFFNIPNSGFVQIVAADGSTGRWWLSTTEPAVGTQSDLVGGNAGPGGVPPASHSHRFRLDVPEPGTLSLLVIGSIALLRRRR